MPLETKKAIAETFVELIRTQNIDKITVKDISDTCGISRQSFYYHFKDILDLVEWIAEQAVQDAVEKSLMEEDPVEALMCLISMVSGNRSVLQKLIHSQHHERFWEMLLTGLRTYILKTARYRYPQLKVSGSELDTILTFYSGGFASVLVTYAETETMDMRQLAQQLSDILSGLYLQKE